LEKGIGRFHSIDFANVFHLFLLKVFEVIEKRIVGEEDFGSRGRIGGRHRGSSKEEKFK